MRFDIILELSSKAVKGRDQNVRKSVPLRSLNEGHEDLETDDEDRSLRKSQAPKDMCITTCTVPHYGSKQVIKTSGIEKRKAKSKIKRKSGSVAKPRTCDPSARTNGGTEANLLLSVRGKLSGSVLPYSEESPRKKFRFDHPPFKPLSNATDSTPVCKITEETN